LLQNAVEMSIFVCLFEFSPANLKFVVFSRDVSLLGPHGVVLSGHV